MRLEINIPDERPEAKILGSIQDPGAYLLDLVRSDRGGGAIKLEYEPPNYEVIFSDARNCPSAFKTKEDVDRYIEELRNEW